MVEVMKRCFACGAMGYMRLTSNQVTCGNCNQPQPDSECCQGEQYYCPPGDPAEGEDVPN